MLPDCSDDEYGILPPADQPYPATLAQIRARFVDEAPKDQRERRALIHSILELHVTLIRRLFRGTNVRIWLNGGFVTHKRWRAPRDADLVAIVDPSVFGRANNDPALPLWTLANVTAQRSQAGPTLVTPKLHTGLGLTDAYAIRSDRPVQIESWRRQWSAVTGRDGTTIEGKLKGFVEVIADEH